MIRFIDLLLIWTESRIKKEEAQLEWIVEDTFVYACSIFFGLQYVGVNVNGFFEKKYFDWYC